MLVLKAQAGLPSLPLLVRTSWFSSVAKSCVFASWSWPSFSSSVSSPRFLILPRTDPHIRFNKRSRLLPEIYQVPTTNTHK
ncbi:hypothetical protein ARMGADRAFT_766065 [Armillaria gallica]|uniref:Uncharacterized protein n=1 Tax=Armillaria gallica TaxID=47427 RepID=A0A2H3CJA2_ARMGA|nr:hypothetical protein ARMGADRAFT_766065 [Armillaria gallica]